MRREKELEERRKYETVSIGPDHPVRKLLHRIREKQMRTKPGATAAPFDVEQVPIAIGYVLSQSQTTPFIGMTMIVFWYNRVSVRDNVSHMLR